ncbi:MAG: dephospho-CoA kinase, partial [Planctomycetaceae bacterium]|nr:dephospho-CoA kinase [Planctomycetaceae bacterium]
MFLTLIGYRGSGKTSVAEALAQKLGLTAVDSDQIIQQRAACTIKQIFERQGETAFRNLE